MQILVFIQKISDKEKRFITFDNRSPRLLRLPVKVRSLEPWTNFSKQDKTWAEFSTLEMSICMLQIYGVIESNCLA